MSLWGKIFGTDEAIAKGIETVKDGFDALIYTEEEKAKDMADSISQARAMLIEWMQASQGHRLARRFISIAITGVWLTMYLFSMFMNIAAVWADNPDKIIEAAKIIGDYADSMNGAVMLILAFYFAAPHIGEVIKPAIDKFSKRPDK